MTRELNVIQNNQERGAQDCCLASRPQRVVLEMTNKCNLRCTMCAISYYEFNQTTLDLAVFEKVWPVIESAREVTLFGYGEPLLNPHFRTIFERCSAVPGLTTYFTTNGILLNTVAETIVRNKLTYLGISADGASPETYAAIRRGGKLERLIDNIRLVNRFKAQFGLREPHMRFAFVGMRDNIQELPRLVELAAELEMDEVKFTYLVAHTEEMRDQALWHHRVLAAECLEQAREAAARVGIKLTAPPAIGEDTAADFHRPCHVAWEELFVGSDGQVRPCIISNEVFGDLKVQDFDTIWNSQAFQTFRKRVNSSCPPHDCQNCWQVRHTNVNREESHVRIGDDIATASVKAG